MKKFLLFVLLVSFVLFLGCGGGTTAKKSPNITVEAVSSDDASPLSGVMVELDGTKGTTDSGGKFVFKNITVGNYTVNASKEDYEDVSQSITVSEGEDQTVTLSLSKKTAVSELKDISTVKSYVMIFKNTLKNGKTSSLQFEIDDFGKKQHFVSINEDGKIDSEIYIVDDKAKLGSGDEWTELPVEQVKGMASGFSIFANTFMANIGKYYNEVVKTPSGTYEFKNLGTETVNGYSANKVRYVISENVSTSTAKVTFTGWVINNGQYKDYTTKILANYEYSKADQTDIDSIEVNITRIGENIDIKLP